MALKLLKLLCEPVYQTGVGPNGDPEQQLIGYDVTRTYFDTDAEQELPAATDRESNEVEPFEFEDDGLVHDRCGGEPAGGFNPGDEFTRWMWKYSRYFGYTIVSPEMNSEACGYEAPSCELTMPTVSVSGTTATISAGGQRGQLRYSRDGGTSSQASNVFSNLVAGQQYTIRVLDTGVANCFRDVTFTVTDTATEPDPDPAPGGGTGTGTTPPPTAPTTVESVSFVLKPVFETFSTSAYRIVRLEVWIESGHFARDYVRLVELEKKADSAGVVSFQLDRMLSSRLSPEAIDLQATSTAVATQVVKNYFCRWRTVNSTTGALGAWANRPLRTALLGGLNMQSGWLTTQPAYKRIAPLQSEFLFLLTPAASSASVLVRRTTQVDNQPAVEEEELVSFGTQPSKWRVLIIPLFTGPLPVGARRMSITVVNEDEAEIGSTRLFELTIEDEPDHRQFLFFNLVGGIDTLRTTGASQVTLEAKVEVAQRGPWHNYGPRQPLRTVFDVSEQRTFRVSTGFLTPTQQKWLQVWMLSRYHWLSSSSGLEPVLISKRNLTYGRSEPRAEGLTFEYELTSTNAGWEQLRP